ncbi:MAG: hypothetical protein WC717_06485, partial [Candidatus Micrarchaeia archaeon]
MGLKEFLKPTQAKLAVASVLALFLIPAAFYIFANGCYYQYCTSARCGPVNTCAQMPLHPDLFWISWGVILTYWPFFPDYFYPIEDYTFSIHLVLFLGMLASYLSSCALSPREPARTGFREMFRLSPT